MTRAHRRLLAGLAASLMIAASLSAGAAARPGTRGHEAVRLPTLLTGWYGRMQVRPSSIYYTGDGSGIIGVLRPHDGLRGPGRGSLRWSTWTARDARGAGTVWIKLGSPTATSPFTRFAVTVSAGRVRFGRFTRLTLHYRLHGRRVTDTRCIPDRGKVSGWGVVFKGRCG